MKKTAVKMEGCSTRKPAISVELFVARERRTTADPSASPQDDDLLESGDAIFSGLPASVTGGDMEK
jgi:hypothetical protein